MKLNFNLLNICLFWFEYLSYSDVCTQKKLGFGFGYWVRYYTKNLNPKIVIPKAKT